MKRKGFLAVLFGFAGVSRAQQWSQCVRDRENSFFCTNEFQKALNNQCPVCGTMAERTKNLADNGWLARCKRCNAAFWTDPEN